MRRMKLAVTALSALIVAAACGAAVAPRSLLDARAAFNKAKDGPASTLAMAQLETAKQALQYAEGAFQDGDDGLDDLSYLAERHAQLADAAGSLEQANRDRAEALEAASKAREEYAKLTQKSLAVARADLEKTKSDVLATKAKLEDETAKRLAAEKKAAEALASLQQLASVKEESRGVVITLSGAVLFATGKYQLLPIARSKLGEVAKALEDQGYKSIVVEGHTDARGSETANHRLSERRAESVRSELVSRGMNASKVSAVGLGESRPVATNTTAEGRANNRRVEIIVQPED